ncbi:VCBS repeat-containing protein [Lentisphaera profundi]|uniref:VCBS repeat-containing protein n=1 Tax=Lentisphaera profundi TaxID=1658616 RepID=A0ABY7VRI2_9BACT|nr:VCBS repeat-containing protein [Lentisphaera profundi]WDE96481.1 VCBS repeat-containing protein [Lentisphaera profundi]
MNKILCLVIFLVLSTQAKLKFEMRELFSGANVNSAQVWDYDGNGHGDVIFTAKNQLNIAMGPEYKVKVVLEMPAGFRKQAIHSRLMDVDGDGDMDFVGTGQGIYWLECPDNPRDTWSFHQITLDFSGSHCVLIADADEDGQLDIVVNNFQPAEFKRHKGPTKNLYPSSIICYPIPNKPKNQHEWKAYPLADGDAPGGSHYMSMADIDGDGQQEMFTGAKGEKFKNGNYFAIWKAGKDRLKPWDKIKVFKDQMGATHLYGADLNVDGLNDLVASRGHGKGLLWFKAPDFKAIEIDVQLERPHTMDIADLDNDGDIDILACGNDSKRLEWYENDGKGNFTRHIISENQQAYDVSIRDINGDGKLDFVIAGWQQQSVRIYFQK